MVDKELVATVLEEAAGELVAHGWCRGTRKDTTTGNMCTLGALEKVTLEKRNENHELLLAARLAVIEAIGEYGLSINYTIVSWNDELDRVADDAVTLLQKAAIQVRERV